MPAGAIGLAALALAYFMSQFFRSFLAVLYPALQADLTLTPEAFADAQGAWWAVFAISQFPIGYALDRFGPRRTAGILLGFAGAGGCAVFAIANDAADLKLAMGLIGLGSAPVLMASYFIFARRFDPQRFATYAATLIGIGTIGNVAASEPMVALETAIGWRNAALVLGAVALAIAAAILVFVDDPEPVSEDEEGKSEGFFAGLRALMAIRGLWLILPLIAVNYAAAANLRSPWSGPFFSDVFGLDDAAIGQATLAMALAMAAGSFIYGPLDRVFGTRKGVVFAGNAVVLALLAALVLNPGLSVGAAILLFALIGAFGHSYPVVIAHAQSFLPRRLVGRGVTFLNFFSIGGAAMMQFASARVYAATSTPDDPSAGYTAIFLLFFCGLAIGLAAYLFSREVNPPPSLRARRRARAAQKAA